jgi:hypothetical protein
LHARGQRDTMTAVARSSFVLTLGLSVLSLAACSSSTPADAGDASTAADTSGGSDAVAVDAKLADGAPFDYCTALSDRATKCGASFDPAKCAATQACADSSVKAEDRGTLLVCLATRACSATEDTCAAVIASKYSSDPAMQAFNKSCMDKRASCADAGASFADDYCGFEAGMFVPNIVNQLRACFDKPCADIGTCYENVVASIGCN